MNQKKKGTPAWVWIGCGCFLCVVLVVAAIGGLGFAGFSWVKGMVEDMSDPQARTAAALDMLGAEALPDGYHARAFFNIPFIMKLVILSDGEAPGEVEGATFEEKAQNLENLVVRSENMGQNTLFYLQLRDRDRQPIESILAGHGGNGADVDLGVDFVMFGELGEGELQVAEQPVTWRAHRAEMETVGGRHPGIFAAVQVSCPSGEVHDLLWFQQHPLTPEDAAEGTTRAEAEPSVEIVDPAAELETTEALPELSPENLLGTPADPEALTALMGHFRLCR